MTIIKFLKKIFFYCSLAALFTAHTARYLARRAFGRRHVSHGARVILVREGRVVLVRHWYAPGVWTLPGGGVGANEALEEAAKREVLEETGLAVNSFGGELGTYHGLMGKRDTVTVLFTEDFGGNLKFSPNFEIMERGFFDFDNLPEVLSPANRRRIEAYFKGIRREKGIW
ncbi:MAG: NUDIX domain-containing protein [Candidatus Giovannonibacteria bacterium]|nr:MAG: NUDIX domain-containing protein [Candidatus Giovannonibacteria bacterium]